MNEKLTKITGWSGILLLLITAALHILLYSVRWVILIPGVLSLFSIGAYLYFGGWDKIGSAKGEKLKYSANKTVFILLVLSIVGVINYLGVRHSVEYDMTGEKIFTLSEQSRNVVESLKRDVTIKGFFQTHSEARTKFKDLTGQYENLSSKIRVEVINADKQPREAQKYNISEYGQAVAVSGDQRVRIEKNTEEDITEALLVLSEKKQSTVYYLTGHGELSPDKKDKKGFSRARTALTDMNLAVKELNLTETGKIPEDCSALLICGATGDFLSQEIKIIADYLKQGGNIAVFLAFESSPSLGDLLKSFSIELKEGIVVESSAVARLMGGDITTLLVSNYTDHPIVSDFDKKSFMPTVKPLSFGGDTKDKNYRVIIRSSGKTSWAETGEGEKVEFNKEQDLAGPVDIALSAQINDKKGRIAVFGDVDFISDSSFDIKGNGNLFTNTVNWILDRENLVSISPNTRKGQLMTLSGAQSSIIIWSTVIITPVISLLIGLMIWIRRRNL